jgi:hypothetical protein
MLSVRFVGITQLIVILYKNQGMYIHLFILKIEFLTIKILEKKEEK